MRDKIILCKLHSSCAYIYLADKCDFLDEWLPSRQHYGFQKMENQTVERTYISKHEIMIIVLCYLIAKYILMS